MKRLKLLASMLCPLSTLFVGCASSALPPPLTAAQAQRLHELPLPYSVGVARYQIPVYSEHLTKALSASGAFRHVAPLETYSHPPALVATVKRAIYGTATIPVAYLLTAGVVPSATAENHGYVFALAPASQRSRKTIVDAHYRGTTTLGWVSLGISALPSYSLSDPEDTQRFRDMLAYRTLVALHPSPPLPQTR